MPSSVKDGSRPPKSDWMRSYSSLVRPWSRSISGVIAGVARVVIVGKFYCRISGMSWVGESQISPPCPRPRGRPKLVFAERSHNGTPAGKSVVSRNLPLSLPAYLPSLVLLVEPLLQGRKVFENCARIAFALAG